MPRVSSIHHINYLVRDLELASAEFAAQLGLQFGPNESLPSRGVVTRRARVGATWMVLVQPTDPNTLIARRLAELGEGVFLLSFGTGDLDGAQTAGLGLGPERSGLDGWRVADLTALSGKSTVLQLCQDPVMQVERRFRGPEASANGGYVSGLIAEAVAKTTVQHAARTDPQHALAVRLRAPPPLDTPLVLTSDANGVFYVHRADGAEPRPIALAEWREFALGPIPAVVPLAAAAAAESRSAALRPWRFAQCFVCGNQRESGDGLRLFAGPIASESTVLGGGLVAAIWRPAVALTVTSSNIVPDRFIWSALDCPGYFALGGERDTMLLAELAVQIYARPRLGDTLIVQGWPIGTEGRAHLAGTALYTTDGRVLAAGRARWQAPRALPESATRPAAN